ncbi:hypothetical protein [Marinospirillum insulare]|uniref:Transposase n=1 Tax=Marinospirillum insulare TaxID=217169 RepID=A0ABQ5ZUQ6_9GAMM|nr:hypothetical protein [Marinospirillum insulare]GLR62787.1 hypothetical protein GCM10007878_02220 [Marinospirillum insulare]
MSKKRKTAFPKDLWVVEYIDRMDRDGEHVSESLSRENTEALYAEMNRHT